MDFFPDIAQLLARFKSLGATRVFFKALSQNDNSKQQIYLGGDFEALNLFRFGEVEACASMKVPNFKAKIDLHWVSPDEMEPARHAQLILYPQYPEVRLSGFLLGCRLAPSRHLQPIPKSLRNGVDGRVLFFGITPEGRTLASLAPAQSSLAIEALLAHPSDSIFTELPLPGTVAGDSRQALLDALLGIQRRGFVPSVRMTRDGSIVSYAARNGGGYTLEALLGIPPNSRAEPDFMGWEVKGYSGNKLTLMTPEPDGGYYGDEGVAQFLRRYGRPIPEQDRLYFTGAHRSGEPNSTTSMTLTLVGYDEKQRLINDVNGSISLIDSSGQTAASWSFSGLLTHWNRKHASAAYVPYEVEKLASPHYRYVNPILLGEGTDFSRYLGAISDGKVIFDPGSKLEAASSTKPKQKARSQFRISRKHLDCLYERTESVIL